MIARTVIVEDKAILQIRREHGARSHKHWRAEGIASDEEAIHEAGVNGKCVGAGWRWVVGAIPYRRELAKEPKV